MRFHGEFWVVFVLVCFVGEVRGSSWVARQPQWSNCPRSSVLGTRFRHRTHLILVQIQADDFQFHFPPDPDHWRPLQKRPGKLSHTLTRRGPVSGRRADDPAMNETKPTSPTARSTAKTTRTPGAVSGRKGCPQTLSHSENMDTALGWAQTGLRYASLPASKSAEWFTQ